ncbi:unnamed protein product, partial [Polarella glacialis]
AAARAAEYKASEEQNTKLWQEELAGLGERRAGLKSEEELQKDCLSYFATADLLLERQVGEDSLMQSAAVEASCPAGAEETELGQAQPDSGPHVSEALEQWLEERFFLGPSCSSPSTSRRRPSAVGHESPCTETFVLGPSGGGSSSSSGSSGFAGTALACSSFGELPAAACAGLAESLVEALRQSAAACESQAALLGAGAKK